MFGTNRRSPAATADALPPAAHDAGDLPQPERHDIGRAGRIGLWTIIVGLGGFLLWAGLAPLDEGVPAVGNVAIDTKRKAVQHPTGGIVREVLVREGSMVKEGDVLVRMDAATARANFESIRQPYLAQRAIQSRLLAEQVGAKTVTFHPDVVAEAKDPLVRKQMTTQEQLFAARRASLQAAEQGLRENIRGQQAAIQAYNAMLVSKRSQGDVLNEQMNSIRDLVKDGYAPRMQLMDLQRQYEDVRSSIADTQGNIVRAQQGVAEATQRLVQLQQDYRKEVESALADVNRDVEAGESKLAALKGELERIEIRSPATGQVVGLSVQTVGAVVQPAQKLMDVVPEGEPLLIETRVPPQVIDKVHPGLPVDVRFSTFPEDPMLVVYGKVASVSHDLLADQQNQAPYYLARVELTPEGRQKLGKRVLQPGMPVDMVIKTGERTVLEYLLHPLSRRVAASMKEV